MYCWYLRCRWSTESV